MIMVNWQLWVKELNILYFFLFFPCLLTATLLLEEFASISKISYSWEAIQENVYSHILVSVAELTLGDSQEMLMCYCFLTNLESGHSRIKVRLGVFLNAFFLTHIWLSTLYPHMNTNMKAIELCFNILDEGPQWQDGAADHFFIRI